MVVPGSEYLGKVLHAVAQSFLIPCILGLLVFLILSFMELGTFVAELRQRRKNKDVSVTEIFQNKGEIYPWQQQNLQQLIDAISLPVGQKQQLISLVMNPDLSPRARVLAGREFLDRQELRAMKTLEKTDLIARLGPVLGLMGTLIPLGPGLSALGQGDVNALAQAVIIAFDTTVVGIAVGGIAFLLSKVRRRWYEKDLSSLEVLLQVILGGEGDAVQEAKAVAVTRK